MRISLGSKQHFESGSWLEAVLEILVGSLTGSIRACYIVTTGVYLNVIRPMASVLGIRFPTGKRKKMLGGKIKVAAVGFGRTGTYSVMLALEELGFPTLHFIHMYAYENEEIMQMWTDRLFTPALESEKIIVGRADWKLIAESGYEAVADFPSCLLYEQILEEFPDSKFILTTRESSEVWFRSWATLTKSTLTSFYLGGLFFPVLNRYSNYLRWLNSVLNKDSSYLTATFPKDENIKENAIASYEEHNQRVREVIPSDQLLEFHVEDGWDSLCTFLEIEHCPTTPFPKSNSSRSVRAQSYSAFWVAALFLLYVMINLRKYFKQRDAVKDKVV